MESRGYRLLSAAPITALLVGGTACHGPPADTAPAETGTVQDDGAPGGTLLWSDRDGDGYAARPPIRHDAPLASTGDCDDDDPAVHPGAVELCGNGIDEDCDGIDPPRAVGYRDADRDGWGDAREPWLLPTCALPDGYVATAGDCDDQDPGANPDQREVARNDVDEDCDGSLVAIGLEWADAKLIGAYDSASGFSLAPLGDLNGDGFDDFAVGARRYDHGSLPRAGAVYVFLGPIAGRDALAQADAVIYGEADHDYLGQHLAPAGDLDGDGVPDLLASGYATPAYVFSGTSRGELTPADAFASIEGWSLGVGVGDMTGDGAGDYVARARHPDWTGGAVYLLEGPLSGHSIVDQVAHSAWVPSRDGDIPGTAFAAAGDVSGDGRPDVLVAEDGYDNLRGAVYVVTEPSAGTLPLLDVEARLLGSTQGESAGFGLGGGADLDGDGYDDVAIGGITCAASDGWCVPHDVVASVVYGPVSGDVDLGTEADARIRCADVSMCHNGNPIAAPGDMDGDGASELAISPVWYGTRLFYGPVFGSPDITDAEIWYLGERGGDLAGTPVSAAGDVNGDGVPDLLLGAPKHDYAGAVYLILAPGF